MKRPLAFFLAVCLLVLCGCGGNNPNPTENTTGSTAGSTTETTTETTTESTTEPTKPVVKYRNPLNGAPLDAPFTGRATAVVINNIKACLPQYGIQDADIYYEIETEGFITRCLAVFGDISKVDTLGPVRSARTYFNNLALAYDSVLVHCGGSGASLKAHYDDGNDTISKWQHLDQTYNGSYFFRDMHRYEDLDYAWEHTLFTKGDLLTSLLEKKAYNTKTELDFGFQFAESVDLNGENANTVTISFPGDKTTTMTYEPVSRRYTMSQYGATTIDASTGNPLTFRNVMVLYTSHWKIYDGTYSRSYYDLIGSGNGYLAIDGKIVPIMWSRESLRKPFVYTLADGTPITLAEGNTYIGVASTKSTPVSYK